MEGTNNERPTVRASALYFVPERATEKVGSAVQGKADVKESPEELVNLSGLEIDVRDFELNILSQDKQEQIKDNMKKRMTDYFLGLNVKEKLSKPVNKEAVVQSNKNLYTPNEAIRPNSDSIEK